MGYTARMQQQLHAYFEGEKLGGLAFGLTGVFAVLAAIGVWRYAAGYRAMLWPLLLVAGVELAVCVGLQVRTGPQVARLEAQLQRDPAGFYADEGRRMAGVMRNFKVIEVVELLALATGIAMAFLLSHREAAFAVALGLILQSSAMLVGDFAAERRGRAYVAALAQRG